MTDVLVLRALGLGDLLTSVPALRGLRRHLPSATTTLAAPEPLGRWFTALGLVDEVLPTAGLTPLDPRRCPSPDLAVNLHGSGPESHRLLTALAPRELLAFSCAEAGHPEGPAWAEDEHEVDRWARLVAWAGMPCGPDDLRLPAPGPRGDQVVVHPGAASGSRRWPVERWVVVARELADRGHDVVVTGGPAEARLCDELTRDPRITRAATDDLSGLAEVVATARLLLCGDTGPAHLATAYGTPSVLLFGPSDPRHWGPRIDAHLHEVLWHPAPGDPEGDPHGERLDPRLARVTVGDVLTAADRLLGSAGGASLFAEPGDGLRETL